MTLHGKKDQNQNYELQRLRCRRGTMWRSM